MTAKRRPREQTASLDPRIANALANDSIASNDIEALLKDVKDAAAQADEVAKSEAERALDPTNTAPAQSRALADQSRFEHARLLRAIPLLAERLRQAQAREYALQWHQDFEQVEAERDALAEELTATYPDLVAKLVSLLDRIEVCDREVDRVNGSAPEEDNRRLLGVELTARGLNCFTAASPSLTANLRLPHPGDTRSLAYPPEQINVFGLQMASAASALAAKHAVAFTPDWSAAKDLEDKYRLEEADRRQAEIARQEREKKSRYERALVEAERDRRVGRRKVSQGAA